MVPVYESLNPDPRLSSVNYRYDPETGRSVFVDPAIEDFTDMERRPAGGGAGVIGWMFAMLIALLAVGMTLGIRHLVGEYQDAKHEQVRER